MSEVPTLVTARLVLRPFVLADAPQVRLLAGAYEVASTTANIPHPYPEGAADVWIAGHSLRHQRGESIHFAVTLAEDHALLGAIGLMDFASPDERAEMGYWIGVPYWNHGYCTEAARAVLAFGFGPLGLHRISARHLARNPASGRVMQKIGMQYEGCLRGYSKKWGVFEDVNLYGILATEYKPV